MTRERRRRSADPIHAVYRSRGSRSTACQAWWRTDPSTPSSDHRLVARPRAWSASSSPSRVIGRALPGGPLWAGAGTQHVAVRQPQRKEAQQAEKYEQGRARVGVYQAGVVAAIGSGQAHPAADGGGPQREPQRDQQDDEEKIGRA